MPRTIIAANWKVNKTIQESLDFIDALKQNMTDPGNVEVVICPPLTAIRPVKDKLGNTPVRVGAQNMFWKDACAYTGEVSARMLKEAGCEYVIVGHSERREHFGETDWVVNKKLGAALESGLQVILCVGETLKDRKSQLTFSVIDTQLKKGLQNISGELMANCVIAYEPVWAIGTGVNASPEQAQEVHEFIRETVLKLYNANVADELSILYGGSVKVENIEVLMAEKSINGALIGGASLDVKSFSEIIKLSQKEG
jgi:triosephosphate isomerase